ncbi:MAG TPA: dienelactone hydrolase family protein [Stellaceae bacterium]|nr:dienelactone hydrolase family protein [Stellaceae bacterium]
MKRFPAWAALLAAFLWWHGGAAQEMVRFPSLDDNGPGQAATVLDGYLYRPPGDGRHPAVVGLHGCGGMFNRNTGLITPLYRAWAEELRRHGYAVLLVDSLGPRRHGEMCSIEGFDIAVVRRRPKDAYGALQYLQAQPFVRGDRVGLVGWSQGGRTILYAIGAQSPSRPAALPQGDFRAAVALYPGGCNEQRQAANWTTAIPLLVLMGEADVWTPMGPCKAFLDGAIGRRAPIEMQIYPDAYHAFDAPDLPRRELPRYRTRSGVVPIIGTDPAARADALERIPAFLRRFLGN